MSKITDWLSRLMGGGASTPLSASPGASTPASPGDDTLQFQPDDVRPTMWGDDISLTLGTLVHDTETRASGRVQVLTLSHLRSELGDGWQRYQSRVIMMAETTIGRMIGKGNLYIPQDEDTWLLLMPLLKEMEAEQRADEIARVLGEKLVGARFEEKEPPLPQTAKVDLSTAMNADGTFNVEAMKTAVKRSRLLLAAKDARRPVAELDKNKAKPKAMTTAASASQASLFPRLSVVYRPLWVAEIESYASFAMRAFTDTGDPVFGPNAPADVQARLNDATIIDLAKAAFADFTTLTHRGLRATYVLPVPFTVMTRQLGAVFLRALAALPQKERLMHMRIELVNVPPTTNVQTLIDVREVFRGRVKDVAFLTELGTLNDKILSLDHISIGAEPKADTLNTDAELAQALGTFRRRVGTRRSYVMGLRSRTHVAMAIHASLDEISGTGLADDIRHLPDRLTVAHKQDLVRGG